MDFRLRRMWKGMGLGLGGALYFCILWGLTWANPIPILGWVDLGLSRFDPFSNWVGLVSF